MSFQNLQTLVLILLFLTPGALFIYVCALHYSPSMRTKYLRDQFPIELTIYYLIVSAVIHTILVLATLGIIAFIDSTHPQAYLSEYLMAIATHRVVPGPRDVSILAVAVIAYFLLSLVLAWVGGRWVGKHLLRPTPLWHDLIAEMHAQAKVEQKPCSIQLQLRGQRELKGDFVDIQCWAEGPDSFQLLISEDTEDSGDDGRQSKKRVWIDSREINEMALQVSVRRTTFIFSREESANGDV